MASEAITRNDLTAILNEVLPSTSVVSNVWVGYRASAASSTTPYDSGGTDVISTNYTTNTGHFIAIGVVPLKTSRYTSRALIKVDGVIQGLAGTNKTSLCTVAPMMHYKGTKGATYNVSLAIGSQDSGTTAYIEDYNHASFIVFDISDDNNGITPMADYIVEQGTDGIWTYRKWASGVAECWGTTDSRNITTSGVFGSLYYTNVEPIATFPSGLFVATPCVTATRNENGSGFGLLSLYGTNANAFNGYVVNGINQTVSMSFAVHAIGRWK